MKKERVWKCDTCELSSCTISVMVDEAFGDENGIHSLYCPWGAQGPVCEWEREQPLTKGRKVLICTECDRCPADTKDMILLPEGMIYPTTCPWSDDKLKCEGIKKKVRKEKKR